MATYQEKTRALNSEIVLTLRSGDEQTATRVFHNLLEIIEEFEQRFSRFLPESELSQLNRSAGTKFTASAELIKILQAAKEMSRVSDGLYNPFVLPSLQKAGYKGSWPKPDNFDSNLDFSTRSLGLITNLEIGQNWVKIPQNSAIDLGGIGKGYLLDKLADQAKEDGIADFWFSLGGDIIFNGNDDGRIGWEIGIVDAKNEERDISSFETAGREVTIATSGTVKRSGKNWHHLIDPRTGKPAITDILAATVIAGNATVADIWAKSLVILGSKESRVFVEDHKIELVYLQTNHPDQNLIKLGQNG